MTLAALRWIHRKATWMAPLKQKGDRAEIEVARDLIKRGFRLAIPYGEDWDFDLIFARPNSEQLERVQVKYTESRDGVICVKCFSHSLTNGKVRRTKKYTSATVDWLGVYDRTTDRCYYVSAGVLGSEGRKQLHLRLTPARNGQRSGIRFAEDYVDLAPPQQSLAMEPAGFEPATFRMQTERSPN